MATNSQSPAVGRQHAAQPVLKGFIGQQVADDKQCDGVVIGLQPCFKLLKADFVGLRMPLVFNGLVSSSWMALGGRDMAKIVKING